MKYYVAQSTSGEIEFIISEQDVNSICQSGDNGPAVHAVYEQPYVKNKLKECDLDVMRDVIDDYGHGFFKDERTMEEIHEELVWLLAWDLSEEISAGYAEPMDDDDVEKYIGKYINK